MFLFKIETLFFLSENILKFPISLNFFHKLKNFFLNSRNVSFFIQRNVLIFNFIAVLSNLFLKARKFFLDIFYGLFKFCSSFHIFFRTQRFFIFFQSKIKISNFWNPVKFFFYFCKKNIKMITSFFGNFS